MSFKKTYMLLLLVIGIFLIIFYGIKLPFLPSAINPDNWEFIGSGNYMVFHIDSSDPIIGEWQSEQEYEQLMKYSYSRASSRIELYNQNREALLGLCGGIRTFSQLKKGIELSYPEFDIQAESRKGLSTSARMVEVPAEGSPILVPKELEYMYDPRILPMPDGKSGTYIVDDKAVWKLDPESRMLLKIPEPERIESEKEFPDHIMDVILAPKGSRLLLSRMLYSSPPDSEYSVSVVDGAENKEIVLCQSDSIFLNGWLDHDTAVFRRHEGEQMEYIAKGLDGAEYILDIDAKKYNLMSVQNGLIAFTEAGKRNELFTLTYDPEEKKNLIIARYIGEGKTEIIYQHPMGNALLLERLSGFSPDGKHYAILYTKKTNFRVMDLMILNLETGKLSAVRKYPERSGELPYVEDFHWFDDSTLILSIPEDRAAAGKMAHTFKKSKGSYSEQVGIWMVDLEQ